MDLSTNYLGLKLRSPLVPSAAGPLSDDLGNIKLMEDSGAAAIVLYSLFEEQLRLERAELHHHLEHGTQSFPEALTYFPEPAEFNVGPEQYLKHIAKAKAAVNIPIIASLNGSTLGGWTDYAQKIQQAGADALELNIYSIPTDVNVTAGEVESIYVDIVKAVKSSITIPVTVKLSPFFTNFANVAKRLADAGADGLVLFNRFYQPDIDLESLEVTPNVLFSTPMAMRLPLRWVAILYGRVNASLAATSGIHRASDVVKMLMVGADVTQLCSVLMRHGIKQISVIEHELQHWLEQHEYESVQQLRGSMSQKNLPDPGVIERASYLRVLDSYAPPAGVWR